MKLYNTFVDEQLEGHFKTFKHKHIFEEVNGVTSMKDVLQYETPFDFLGKLFDQIFLKKHLINFLIIRNQAIKFLAENMIKT
jgi:ligand-binding SRPBCC domain-containing protein